MSHEATNHPQLATLTAFAVGDLPENEAKDVEVHIGVDHHQQQVIDLVIVETSFETGLQGGGYLFQLGKCLGTDSGQGSGVFLAYEDQGPEGDLLWT